MQGAMKWIYEKQQDGIKIERIEDPEMVVEVPEMIEGCPVTELGAYALAGSGVEELRLPSRLKKIGAYAFYQCEKLRRIFCYGRTLDLGTGLFAGAGNVELLDITQFPGEKSCLKELLSELRQTLRVRIHELPETEAPEAAVSGAEGIAGGETAAAAGRAEASEARLIFPEYYEESVENTPARILFIETHGCGHRYRYCFNKTQFQYRDYDELFPHVQVQEPEELVTELALGRLMYPCGLSAQAKEMYRKYAAEHWRTAGKLLIGMHRLKPGETTNLEAGRLPWLVETIFAQTETSEELSEKIRGYMELAQRDGDTESVSWLMDFKRNMRQSGASVLNGGTGQKKRRFEL